MIIKGENDVVIGNAGETKTFTIAASAKAFKVLSSNIYKNKIRAVVRELVCNAVDAHVLNGNKRPHTQFKVLTYLIHDLLYEIMVLAFQMKT